MRQRRETVERPFSTIEAWMQATPFLMKELKNVRTEMALSVLAIVSLQPTPGDLSIPPRTWANISALSFFGNFGNSSNMVKTIRQKFHNHVGYRAVLDFCLNTKPFI